MKDDRFNTGCLVPKFHGDDHRLQMAFLVILIIEDLKDLPELLAYPVKVQLKRSAADLEEGNAPDFVEDYRKAEYCLEMIRAILDVHNRKRKAAAHDTSRNLNGQ